MTRPTMGPWIVVDGHYPGIREIRGASFTIKFVTVATDVDVETAMAREADARLIAAAPDLLGVARSVMMMKRLGGMLPGVKEIIDSVVADAEEAIKKVEDPQ